MRSSRSEADDPGAAPSGRPDRVAQETSLRELALLFLRLGATAFGGPAAHIAMMQNEVVRRRAWLTEGQFLDLLSATNLIPGPNSTELAIHIGWARGHLRGLLVAGIAFILPAMLLTAGLGWAYVRFGSVPSAAWLLYGIKPVIVGVVLQAILGLAPRAARSASLRVLGVAAIAAAAIGADELVVLFGAGVSTVFVARHSGRPGGPAAPLVRRPLALLAIPSLPVVASGAAAAAVTLPGLFGLFLKIGSVLFGSGYVLIAFLRADLVERLGWLTEGQLLDAVAVGQLTPGPVFTTATFVGYVLAGPSGAWVATVGIFLPAFVFVAISGPLVPRLRRSTIAAGFLDGVNVASLALMTVATARIARAALIDVPTAMLGLIATMLLVRWKVDATWLLLGGAVGGWCAHALGLAG